MLFADEMMALDIDFENMEPLMVLAELASQLSAVTAAVSAEPELMTIDVFCCHQYDVNALEVHSDTTVGDLYIDVSAKTSLPMCCFRLVHNYDILPAGSNDRLWECGLEEGSRIEVKLLLEKGIATIRGQSSNSLRETVRVHVYQLSPQQVSDFFDGKHQLTIAVPKGKYAGVFKLQLNRPMPVNLDLNDQNSYTLDTFNLVWDVKLLNTPLPEVWTPHLTGALSPDVFNSRGIPGRTVDTIVSILDALVESL